MRTQNYQLCECVDFIPGFDDDDPNYECHFCKETIAKHRLKPVLALIFDTELERSKYAAYLAAIGDGK